MTRTIVNVVGLLLLLLSSKREINNGTASCFQPQPLLLLSPLSPRRIPSLLCLSDVIPPANNKEDTGGGDEKQKKNLPKNAMKGPPMGPRLLLQNDGDDDVVLVRYMYDGSVLSQGRILRLLAPDNKDAVTGLELLWLLEKDGVDFRRFYACVYETEASSGGWLPIDQNVVDLSSSDHDDDVIEIPLPPATSRSNRNSTCSRRIDVKLVRRQAETADGGIQHEPPLTGRVPIDGYHGIGVVGIKTQANVGTLWRSAYQLGSSFLFTVGARYKHQPTDTVSAMNRVPFFELDDWAAFCRFSPRGARWVAIETGGTPLADFEHPRNAVYILGSEDAGLPNSIVRACHEVVSIDSERYASYNVAVAGTIVLYDRLQKKRKRRREANKGKKANKPTEKKNQRG